MAWTRTCFSIIVLCERFECSCLPQISNVYEPFPAPLSLYPEFCNLRPNSSFQTLIDVPCAQRLLSVDSLASQDAGDNSDDFEEFNSDYLPGLDAAFFSSPGAANIPLTRAPTSLPPAPALGKVSVCLPAHGGHPMVYYRRRAGSSDGPGGPVGGGNRP